MVGRKYASINIKYFNLIFALESFDNDDNAMMNDRAMADPSKCAGFESLSSSNFKKSNVREIASAKPHTSSETTFILSE